MGPKITASIGPSKTSLNPYWPWMICGLLLAATMLNYMDRLLLNQAAKQIRTDLHFESFSWTTGNSIDRSDLNYSFLESAFGISYALGALFFGYAADRIAVVWLYPACVLAWSLAGIGSGLAQDYPQLLASRCVLGFFEAANWPCGLVTTRALLSREKRSLGNGILHGGGALGAMITPLLLLLFSLPGGWWDLIQPGAIQNLLGNKALVPDWRLTFKLVGCFGGVWAVVWLALALPQKAAWHIKESDPSSPLETHALSFLIRFVKDRRFWILLVTVCSINTTWHILRVWLPLYLQEAQEYTFAQLSLFSMVFYLMADIGAMGAGALTLVLAKQRGVDGARLTVFSLGAVICLLVWGSRFLDDGWALRISLWLAGMASMSLFPIYFAQTQEVSPSHTGKITGLMGFFCWGFLFFSQAAAGMWISHRKDSLAKQMSMETTQQATTIRKEAALKAYSETLGFACLPPLIAMVGLALWPAQRPDHHLDEAGNEMGTL